MVLNLLKKNIDEMSCSTLVLFSKITSQKAVKLTHARFESELLSAVKNGSISGKHLESVFFRQKNLFGFEHVLVVGLGNETQLTHELVRQVAAQVVDSLKAHKINEAAVHLDALALQKKSALSFVKAFAEGAELAAYSFDELKSKSDEKKTETHLHCVLKNIDVATKKAFNEGSTIGQCTNFSKRLGDLPGNLMTPTILAETTQKAAKGLPGVKVTVWDKARITKEKMGGLLGVSQGSSQEPKFIIVEYKGAAASKKPVIFVGKGLTFDCGGISIKPSAAMEEMKYDMCGGANVIGAVLAMAQLKLKVNAYALVPATENLAGPSATKPGDVHTARNGKTFEVNNTDAEGRLILSDALCYASELKPQAIFDAATLTGAMVVALGNIHTGYFTRNSALSKKIEDAAEASGELVWRMPLVDHHVKDMKGSFADLSNISSGKGAGSATAAAFLEQFVTEDLPWAHFDIAGTGWAAGNRLNYCPKKGASGAILRTFIELARLYQ
jgi:leucyl aminopeptidase